MFFNNKKIEITYICKYIYKYIYTNIIMNWTKKEYYKWIEDGQPINLLVTKFDILFSNINSLNGIENLVNLKELICGNNNQLTSLKGIENLVNLTTLYCGNSQLTSLKGIENLINLTVLNCIIIN